MSRTQVPGWKKVSENHYIKKNTTLGKEEIWLRKIGDNYVVIWESQNEARIPSDRPINNQVFNSKGEAENRARKWMRRMRDQI